MSAVVRMRRTGDPSVLVLEEEVVGSPGRSQVKLRQEAIGVNYIDAMFRSGAFNANLPFVTGVEASGVITETGANTEGFAVGDRIAYFFAPGAYAEERIIDVAPLVHLPDDVPSEIAAGLLTKGVTAWLAVRKLHEIKAGDRVLVQGATGGVGSLVVRWAKALGATVVAVGSSSKLARISADADHVLASDQASLADRIRAVAPQGVDVVYEFVGKATFAASVQNVRDGGAIFTIGAASGSPEIDGELLAERRLKVSHASAAGTVKDAMLAQAATEVFDQWRDGIFGEIELQRYRLADAGQAHADYIARKIGPNPILVP
ncbi:zinc-binding dehydrogenase [Mesorhizobium escarrei]|uniref:PKS_ER domain-containing protein n=1 Tax=Mesorhizobium escarrei TaxID=666018 RepID=A0ABN8K3R2_9HYPH|nr:zinc-binding dehydrogenase [Mesorhizobium escarrei]CAH2404140.1 PKS_ER domain-containing protein [Mesorhizobium escarrei]